MIYLATTDDVDSIARLETRLFDNAMSLLMLERELAVGAGYLIGRPLQAYALVRCDKGLFDLTRLGVDPGGQGQGLGTQLLIHVLALGTVVLTVRKDNERALRLYRRHGFEIVAHLSAERAWVLRRASEASVRPSP
jgi:ribosomal-protein-alanine N-acetyltransferase